MWIEKNVQFYLIVVVFVVALVSLAFQFSTIEHSGIDLLREPTAPKGWKPLISMCNIHWIRACYIHWIHSFWNSSDQQKNVGTCLVRRCKWSMRVLCSSQMLVLRDQVHWCTLAVPLCLISMRLSLCVCLSFCQSLLGAYRPNHCINLWINIWNIHWITACYIHWIHCFWNTWDQKVLYNSAYRWLDAANYHGESCVGVRC